MAQYIFAKRKQQTIKHAPLAIMLCLLFLFSTFVNPSFVFADSGNFTEVTTVTHSGAPTVDEFNNSNLIVKNANNNYWAYCFRNSSGETRHNYYCFYTYGTNQYKILFFTDNTSSNLLYQYNSANGSSGHLF